MSITAARSTGGAAEWLAAAREAVITPDAGYPMAGYGSRTGSASGTHDELHARVLALSAAGSCHLLVHLDVLWITPSFRELFERRLRRTLGDVEVSLVATHTHGGPELDARTEPWVDGTADTMTQLCADALEGLEPARLTLQSVPAPGYAMNRRPGNDLIDPEVPSLAIFPRKSEVPLAILANVTCHPVVLGPDNTLYTADYPGYLSQRLKEVFGQELVPLFSCGAAGDINTGHTAEASAIGEFIPNRTFERAMQIGRRYADAVISSLGGDTTPLSPLLDSVTGWYALRYRPLPEPTALTDRARRLEEEMGHAEGQRLRELKIERMYLGVLEVKRRERDRYGEERITLLQALRIGETRHLFVPGELFVALGLKLKTGAPGTFVHGYANDYVGYLPTEAAWHEGGYEQVACPFPAGSAEEMTRALDRLAERLRQVGQT